MAVERWTGNGCEILEIDPPTLVAMAAEDEPVLKAPRIQISGLNIKAASPGTDLAKSMQNAMAGADVSTALARIASTGLAGDLISRELQRTMEELRSAYVSRALKPIRDQQSRLGNASARTVSRALGANRPHVPARQDDP